MNQATLLFSFFLFAGCAYKSIIIKPAKNATSVVYLGQESKEATASQGAPTILSDHLDLETYLMQIPNQSRGHYSIFLSTSTVFVEAKAEHNGPFTRLTGIIYRKDEPDTSRFSYNLNNLGYLTSIEKVGTGDYQLKMARNLEARFLNFPRPNTSEEDYFLTRDTLTSDRIPTFYLKKTQQFRVEKGVMDVLTGEISYGTKSPYKYVVINDPDKGWIDAVSFLVALDAERMEGYSKKCAEEFKGWCSNGYQANYYWHFFEYRIYCECKK